MNQINDGIFFNSSLKKRHEGHLKQIRESPRFFLFGPCNSYQKLCSPCLNMAVIHKIIVNVQTGKTLIRLLLKKQSDLDLHCLSWPFLQTG